MKNRTDIDRLHNEIQELVDELWHLPRFAGGRHGFRPQADCIRSEDPPELRVIVELPGVDPATIKVVAADRMLVVAGERRRPQVSGRYRQLEIEYGPFQRRIPLDEPVDAKRRERPLRAGHADRHPADRGQGAADRARGDRDPRPRMSELNFEEPFETTRRRDPVDAAGAAAEGDGRLPAVDDAARDRPGALDPARRRRRSRASGMLALVTVKNPRTSSSPAGTTSTRSAPPRSSTR